MLMSKIDAKKFLDMLEKDVTFQNQIANSRNETECLKAIHGYHLQFDEKEFVGAFEEKYHRPLKKEELHKMAQTGLIPANVAAKLPFVHHSPHHGE